MGFLHSKRAYPRLKPLTSMCVCVCVCDVSLSVINWSNSSVYMKEKKTYSDNELTFMRGTVDISPFFADLQN